MLPVQTSNRPRNLLVEGLYVGHARSPTGESPARLRPYATSGYGFVKCNIAISIPESSFFNWLRRHLQPQSRSLIPQQYRSLLAPTLLHTDVQAKTSRVPNSRCDDWLLRRLQTANHGSARMARKCRFSRRSPPPTPSTINIQGPACPRVKRAEPDVSANWFCTRGCLSRSSLAMAR